MRKKPRLRVATTAVLYILADIGPGGGTAQAIAARTGKRIKPRAIAARLRWLKRVGFVRHIPDDGRWQLTDDSMFTTETTNVENK